MEAVKTSEVVCQLFFLFLSLAHDACFLSCTLSSSMMTGRRHLEMTLTAATQIFSLAKTFDPRVTVLAWRSVNHRAVKPVDKFVRYKEHAFANSDR